MSGVDFTKTDKGPQKPILLAAPNRHSPDRFPPDRFSTDSPFTNQSGHFTFRKMFRFAALRGCL